MQGGEPPGRVVQVSTWTSASIKSSRSISKDYCITKGQEEEEEEVENAKIEDITVAHANI